jgi:hypothetical protein
MADCMEKEPFKLLCNGCGDELEPNIQCVAASCNHILCEYALCWGLVGCCMLAQLLRPLCRCIFGKMCGMQSSCAAAVGARV